MGPHLLSLSLFVAGLVALVAGADLLVRGASKLALALGISPLVVGLTVVAFGTSAPEMAVSAGAVLSGQTGLALGNVVGSNILNLLFILGLSALVVPLAVHLQIIRQEMPVLILISGLVLWLARDGVLGVGDGTLLLLCLLAYTVALVLQSRRITRSLAERAPSPAAAPAKRAWDERIPVQLALIAAGLALLVLGSDWLVTASVAFARSLGVSEVVIGLTIVAAGTSMPEVATSVAAALKGERDIAVGNVVGSCTFNLLGCLGLSAVLAGNAGLPVAQSLLEFDLWILLAAALVCLPLFFTGHEISRLEGALLLIGFALYLTYVVLAARGTPGLLAPHTLLWGVAVPMVVLALLASTRRPRRR
ncbi:MAG: calcium/sodium antiporter [Burkholderiaceae bacterium]|jgi:cation:H+ antiporter|nr:calcium/sodium antiporter [Burkholderiaceae bacterium]MCO5103933.1 calcium/sodium antiporter [Burkholderiaceae bacterium]